MRAWIEDALTWLRRNVWDRLRTLWTLRKAPELMKPGAQAMKKVYHALPGLAPDTLSAGVQNGGEALFFRHDEGIEVIIGRDYDHAAEMFIQWYREEKAADVAPTTRTTSRMNRHERRVTRKGVLHHNRKERGSHRKTRGTRKKKRGHSHRSR